MNYNNEEEQRRMIFTVTSKAHQTATTTGVSMHHPMIFLKTVCITLWTLLTWAITPGIAATMDTQPLSISLDQDTIHWLQMHHANLLEPSFASPLSVRVADNRQKLSLVQIKPENLEALSAVMHLQFHRCGGFMIEDSPTDFVLDWAQNFTTTAQPVAYSIGMHDQVNAILKQISARRIRDTIAYLSGFENRYYRSSTGIRSQESIHGIWKKLTLTNPDISVELVQHSAQYPQPSVRLVWKGSKQAEEIIVLGGHGDSIALNAWGGVERHAPGADDNASGIATITEALHVLALSGWQPERSIHLFSYAAEEIGLKGSSEIAATYLEQHKKIVGVLQYDMTNHPKNTNEIGLVSDYTNAAQNQFVRDLVTTYLPHLHVTSAPCGYACSDHASWHRRGYVASMPFESNPQVIYSKIHTSEDTLANSDATGNHAAKFAQLAVAYLVEMATIDK
ncbi:MAG: M20/M25/M40 family metallo-hydrolase [Zetaproteobacteria bacterium]|nr:M20/M25/M40 family metallo-hydrolase [Zetaproteobacteria bacterium]